MLGEIDRSLSVAVHWDFEALERGRRPVKFFFPQKEHQSFLSERTALARCLTKSSDIIATWRVVSSTVRCSPVSVTMLKRTISPISAAETERIFIGPATLRTLLRTFPAL